MGKALEWAKGRGAVGTLRVVFVAVGLYLILSTIGIPWAPLNIKILVGINVAILWLFLELALDGRVTTLENTVSWDSVVAKMKPLIRNGVTVNMVGSSTSTFYIAFHDALLHVHDASIRVVMRAATNAEDAHWIRRVEEYASYWKELTNSSVEVRYSDQVVLRMVRIGDSVAMGGYVWDDLTNRYLGHTTPMLVSDEPSVVQLHNGLFDHLWREACSTPIPGNPTSPQDTMPSAASDTQRTESHVGSP